MAMPNYSELIGARIAKTPPEKVHPSWGTIDLENLKQVEDVAIRMRFPTMQPNLVMGDSHAISLYRPGWTVNSVP